MKKAACRGQPIEKFFEEYETEIQTQIETNAMCDGCPVRKQCKAYANSFEAVGMYAGEYYDQKVAPEKRGTKIKSYKRQKQKRTVTSENRVKVKA